MLCALPATLTQRWPVLLDELIENRLLRPMAPIGGRVVILVERGEGCRLTQDVAAWRMSCRASAAPFRET